MDPKLLTEEGWDKVAPDCKGKDKELRRALLFYWSLEDDDFDFRGKALGKIAALAGALKGANEVKGDRGAVKHLTDVISASKVKQGELTKARAEAGKAKAQATKAVAMTQKKADANAKAAKEEEEGGGEEEEEEGAYPEKLKKALNSLKTAKAPYNFIVCDAKPFCGVVISRQIIGAKHKEELTGITGGSKRFMKPGTCRREGTTLIFEMENPPQGLATKLLKSIKYFSGIKYKVMVGQESADESEESPSNRHRPDGGPAAASGDASTDAAAPANAPASPGKEPAPQAAGPLGLSASVGRGGKNKPEDVSAVQTALNTRNKAGLSVNGKCDSQTIKAIEEFQKLLGKFKPDGLIEPRRGTVRALASTAKLAPPPAPPKPIAPPKLGKATLAKAPMVWHSTRNILNTNIEELKKGVRAEYGPEDPELLRQIDESMVKLSGVLGKLDTRLADSLDRANSAKDDAARKAELKNAKTILTDYIKYVKTEPLIAHMDANPFGVQTNLKKVLTDSLTHMAQAIG